MKKSIVLIGGGNHVSYSIDIIEKEGKYNIAGVIDSVKPIGTEVYGYKVIGRQENVKQLVFDYKIEAGIITIGDNWARKKVRDCIVELLPGFEFVNAIHPSVIIGKNVQLGAGVIAMAGVIINPNARIGDFCFFATGAQVEHDCIVEDFASISAGSITGGMVRIGKYSAVTLGVTVMDRVSIGENSVIGSGSLVVKDVPDNVLVYGNPARVIRSRREGERFLKS